MTNPVPGPGAAPLKDATVKEPAAPKEKKARAPRAKKERDPNAPARPRLPKFPDEHVVTVMKPGSKSRGAAERFNQYHTGITIKDYVEKLSADPFKRSIGQTQADLRWDQDHGFIHVGPTVVAVPAPEATAAA